MRLRGLLRFGMNLVRWYPRSWFHRSMTIGSQTIRLPPHNRLDLYAKTYPYHNEALSIISATLAEIYPGFCAIDIGAHTGDTAAYINADGRVPVLGIEGDPRLWEILEENSRRIGPHIRVERCFVSSRPDGAPAAAGANPGPENPAAGPARAEPGREAGPVSRSFAEILGLHPEFATAKFLKTDTDGHDFAILTQALPFLERNKPVILLEYDPSLAPRPGDSLDCIASLMKLGYSAFVAYDNYGSLSHILRDQSDFVRLNRYLSLVRATGTGPVFYDICAVHASDGEFLRRMLEREMDPRRQGEGGRAPA